MRTVYYHDGTKLHYRVTRDVDFTGEITLRINGKIGTYPLRVEAKSSTLHLGYSKRIMGAFTLSNLNRKQRNYLQDNTLHGGLSCVHLSWWYDGQCSTTHIITWRQWLRMEKMLQEEIAVDDKRFKGKSLRWHADRDIIEDPNWIANCLVFKARNRWWFSDGHWLEKHVVKNAGEQQQLPF